LPAIAVRELRKDYGPVRALRGISFDVAEGEIFGLLGPNGAGKTTTLEILEGYEEPTSGDASVLGERPGSAAVRARTGIVLQSGSVDPFLTVEETVRMYAGWYPSPLPVSDVLEGSGLSELAGKKVRRLSGGQRRRLDLAVALAGDPELVFLDEPTTGFDPVARREAWESIRALAREGRTVLLTTHHLEEAQTLADRVAIISSGRLVAEGSPDTLTGGRGVIIRVRLPEPPPGAEGFIGLGDGLYEARREDPAQTLQVLTGWALSRGISLESLEVSRASLEDVYLDLISEEAAG